MVCVLVEPLVKPGPVSSTRPKGVSLTSAVMSSPVVTLVVESSVPLAKSAPPGPMATPVNGECVELATTVPANEPAVPAHQRRRGYEEDAPAITTDQAGESSKHGAVGGGVARPCNLAA